MKKIKFSLVLLAIFAILGGTAFAFDATDHVKIAPNGQGDLIFFPWYLAASGGWQTQISVINTSSTYSTVAKVVIRSHNWSDEVLDFLIFLTPNDVWTGFVRYGSQGTYIYSDDDSILVSKPAGTMVAADVATYFASPGNAVTQTFFPVKCPGASTLDNKTDSNDYGYVEVIEVNATTSLGTGKLSKHLVYNWYEGTQNDANMFTANILTGYQEFQNTVAGSYSALTRGQVYADWKNNTFLRTVSNTGLLDISNNTIGELEAAMAKTNVALPYIWKDATQAATLHFFTFPTKLSFKAKTSESACNSYVPASLPGPYFRKFASKCVDYNASGYDLKENTVGSGPFSGGTTTNRMCEEMQWFPAYIPGDLFTEGWIRYYWAGSAADVTPFSLLATATTGIYMGAPVLASSLYIRAASVSQAEAAWSQNSVTVLGDEHPYYQYCDEHIAITPIP